MAEIRRMRTRGRNKQFQDVRLLTMTEWYEERKEETEDLSYQKLFTCVNHTGMLYSSKNPTCRSTFVIEVDPLVALYNRPDLFFWSKPELTNPTWPELPRTLAFIMNGCDCPPNDIRRVIPVKQDGE